MLRPVRIAEMSFTIRQSHPCQFLPQGISNILAGFNHHFAISRPADIESERAVHDAKGIIIRTRAWQPQGRRMAFV